MSIFILRKFAFALLCALLAPLMGELSDYDYRDVGEADERFTVFFTIYSLGFDRTFNRDTFRRDASHETELDASVFCELAKLREALSRYSGSQYLKQQFFRLAPQADIDARVEQPQIAHLPPVRWISSSERAAELVRAATSDHPAHYAQSGPYQQLNTYNGPANVPFSVPPGVPFITAGYNARSAGQLAASDNVAIQHGFIGQSGRSSAENPRANASAANKIDPTPSPEPVLHGHGKDFRVGIARTAVDDDNAGLDEEHAGADYNMAHGRASPAYANAGTTFAATTGAPGMYYAAPGQNSAFAPVPASPRQHAYAGASGTGAGVYPAYAGVHHEVVGQHEQYERGERNERVLRIAAVRYTRAYARYLSDFIGEEEGVFLRYALLGRRPADSAATAEAAGHVSAEVADIRNVITQQVAAERLPVQQFTQILIRREALTRFLEIAYALRNCWGDQDGMRALRESEVARRLFK